MFLGLQKPITANWKHIDRSVRQQLNAWNEPAPVFERSLFAHELFDLFLTNTETERICVKSTNYSRLKGNHLFTMTVEKLKVFLMILLVSEYAGLSRQDMYWERREGCHNLVVIAMMTKTEFLECKRYLYQIDKNALNSSDKFAKVRLLFNAINKQCILNYQFTQHVSIDKRIVPYFGKHGTKQYIHGKPIKFGFKLWVIATPLEYFIRFRPYAGNDSILPEYENIELGLGVSLVVNLVSKLPVMQTSNYHFVMDNYITSLALLRHLSAMELAAKGMVRAHRVENAPL